MPETLALQQDDESRLRYPGWSVATAAFAGVMTSFSPIVPYTFSLFLNPLHAAFGWKRATMDGTFAIAAITVALVSPFIGMLLDRFPPRRIILPAIFVFALALASLSRLGGNISQFYVTFFVLGLVANGTAQFAYTRTILTWFQRRRGIANCDDPDRQRCGIDPDSARDAMDDRPSRLAQRLLAAWRCGAAWPSAHSNACAEPASAGCKAGGTGGRGHARGCGPW